MAQRIDSVESTRLKDVEPGVKTGIYYITLCNLPFGTHWQDLKDFARSACEVDHVEVFQSSTSGWVRIKGKRNFEKAWKLLNGGHFNGRSIIASDRNKRESIKIKELIDASLEASGPLVQPSMQYTLPVSPPHLAPASCGQEVYMNGYPQTTTASYAGRPVAIPGYGLRASMLAAPHSENYDATDCYNNAYSSVQVSGDAVHCWSHEGSVAYHAHTDWPSSYARSIPQSSSDYLATEPRKILVTHISHQARAKEVTAWIQKKIGSYANKIGSIDVPCCHSSSELRGHAYIVFQTSSSAKHAVKLLHEGTFKGRKVSAKIAIEGVPEVASGSYEDSLYTEKEWGKSHRSKHKESISSNSTSASHFSSKSSCSKHSEKSGKKDKKEKRDSGPVIVDGSSRKKSR